MFTQARLKLTGWYLLILMTVSFLFSTIIYLGVTMELERGFHRAELRLRARELGLMSPTRPHIFLVEDMEAAKLRVFYWLVTTNSVIFCFGAFASFALAGKTLAPIQEALEEQKRFITDASHELHTPLTALKTSIEVALRERRLTPTEVRRVLKDSLEEVNELATLTQNLLSLSHFEKNGRSVHLIRVDFADLMTDVVKRLTPLIKKKNIILTITGGAEVLQADENSLQQLLTILIDNAVKYTPFGGRVEVGTKRTQEHSLIYIKDTGIGISEKDLPHIFDRFYRADNARTKDETAGFGLGLAIAKRIVDLHHGTISVESHIGKGSQFTVLLPLSN